MISHILTLCVGLLVSLTAVGADSDLASQRSRFAEAEAALNKAELPKYRKLLPSLEHYPLYPYLIHQELSQRISRAGPHEVRSFISKYPDFPLNSQLEKSWLNSLARQHNWDEIRQHYRGQSDAELQCLYLRALYHTGDKKLAMESTKPLWLAGQSQPDACDSLFAIWQESEYYSGNLAWERFQLAITSGNYQLANYLQRLLNSEYQSWARLWLSVRQKPELILSDPQLKNDRAESRAIIAYGVKRLSRFNIDDTWDIWRKLKSKYKFPTDEIHAVERRLALSTLMKKQPVDYPELTNLLSNPVNQDLQEWRIRASLSVHDWESALVWLDRLGEDQKQSPTWRYWRARALEELQGAQAAKDIYEDLSNKRHYYGFLAAERIGTQYNFQARQVSSEQNEISSISNIPAIMRAREFIMLNRNRDARREWYAATREMDGRQLAIAAKIADQWGWHDRAILTIAKTPYMDDIEIRFPVAFQKQVFQETEKQNIDPAWVMAVIRQESAFMTDARSPKGALGLMQIMPGTGKEIGKWLNIPIRNQTNLLDTDLNIKFGVSYLRKNLDRFRKNMVLATAAYNAGNHRVNAWLPETTPVPADMWVEGIVFSETRNYVQNIMAYSVIYDHRLGRKPQPMSKRMFPVLPASITSPADIPPLPAVSKASES